MKIIIIFLTLVFALVANATIEMAITVDDLPMHSKIPVGSSRLGVAKKMLKALKKHKIPEVYGFINAGKVELDKTDLPVLTEWVKAGYPLGNHGYSHMDLHKSEPADFIKDVERNESLLKELNGTKDWKYFRYPFLREGNKIEKRNSVRKYLLDSGYKIAQVTVDFEDWTWNNPYARCKDIKDAKKIKFLKRSYLEHAEKKLDQAIKVSDFVFKRPIKHILLLHIGAFDAEMMDDLLKLYKRKGVKFISLSEACKDGIYSIDPSAVGEWGSELQFQVLKSKGLKLDDVDKTEIPYPEDFLNQICKSS